MNVMYWVKILIFLFCINSFFHSPEHIVHFQKKDKIITHVKFRRSSQQWGQRCFQPKLSLKNWFSPSIFYLVQTGEYAGERTPVRKASPSSREVTARKSALEGAAHGNRVLMRKSIYSYPHTRKYKNMTAFGLEQKILVPNELCKFTIS